MALKDPILQQGFEIICKNLTDLEKENAELKEEVKALEKTDNTNINHCMRVNGQLTKVNLLLKDVYKIAMDDWNDPKWHDQVLQKAREYLKEIKSE